MGQAADRKVPTSAPRGKRSIGPARPPARTPRLEDPRTVTVVTQPVIRRVLEGCGAPCVEIVTAEALHRDCFCVAVDPDAVRDQVNGLLASEGAPMRLTDAHAHLFAALPIFVPEHTVRHMEAAVQALSAAVATPAFVDATLAWASPIAQHDPGSPGGLLGFDFHLGSEGPRLI